MKITDLLQKNFKYVALILVGVVCVIFASVPGNGSSKSASVEKRLKTTLEMAEGVGDVDVMLTFDENNKVEGAIIVAEGAENTSVKKNLHDSAVAVLNLPDYKVKILIKKKWGEEYEKTKIFRY